MTFNYQEIIFHYLPCLEKCSYLQGMSKCGQQRFPEIRIVLHDFRNCHKPNIFCEMAIFLLRLLVLLSLLTLQNADPCWEGNLAKHVFTSFDNRGLLLKGRLCPLGSE